MKSDVNSASLLRVIFDEIRRRIDHDLDDAEISCRADNAHSTLISVSRASALIDLRDWLQENFK